MSDADLILNDTCGNRLRDLTCGRANGHKGPHHDMTTPDGGTVWDQATDSPLDKAREAALRAGVWHVVEQRAKALKDEAKAELALTLTPGDSVAGKWAGRIVAKASMARGRSKLVITDERVLVEWLRDSHPTELVTTVNTAYLRALEDRAKALGVPVDENGEAVPGVELVDGDPYVSVRRDPAALDVVAQIMSGGGLTLDGIKELGAGDE